MKLFEDLREEIDTSTSWGTGEFTTWQDEQLSWKTTAYVGDWSWLDEFHITGPDALRFMSDYAINSFAKFAIGQAKHAVFCNHDGKVIGEGILLRLGDEEFEFQSRGPVVWWLQYCLDTGKYDATAKVTISKFKLQVSGPQALSVLEKVTGQSLRDIRFMHFVPIALGDVRVSFLRQGMAGEIGFELQGPQEHASEVRAAIIEAGREFGLRQLGSRTAMINHLEAAFPTITHDYIPAVGGAAEAAFRRRHEDQIPPRNSPEWFRSFARSVKVKGSFEGHALEDWYRSPVELNWGKSIKFDHDFYGKEALAQECDNPRRKLVTLEWNKDDLLDVYASLFEEGEPYEYMEMPRHSWNVMYACKVMDGDKTVGVSTSRGYSFHFRKMLSHCVVDIEHAEPGTELTLVWGDPGTRQKIIRVKTASSPYKNDKRRVDLKTVG